MIFSSCAGSAESIVKYEEGDVENETTQPGKIRSYPRSKNPEV